MAAIQLQRDDRVMAVDTKMTKSAAEHWVCSMLARNDWAAALTREGIARTDVLAVKTTDTRQMIEVQVKGAQDLGSGHDTSWLINAHAQQLAVADHEWFVLVLLPKRGTFDAPRSFVIPRDHLSAAAWIVHHEWLRDPTVPTGKRNTPVERTRLRAWRIEGYEDRWDLLDSPTAHAPVLLDADLRDWAQRPHIGLPERHPWRDDLPEWG